METLPPAMTSSGRVGTLIRERTKEMRLDGNYFPNAAVHVDSVDGGVATPSARGGGDDAGCAANQAAASRR